MLLQVEFLQQLQMISYVGSFVVYGILTSVAFRIYAQKRMSYFAILGTGVACLLTGSIVDALVRYLPQGDAQSVWFLLGLGGTCFFTGSYMLLFCVIRPAGKSTGWRLAIYAIFYFGIIIMHWIPGIIVPFYDSDYQYWFYNAGTYLFWAFYALTLLPIIDIIYLVIRRMRKGLDHTRTKVSAACIWLGIIIPILGQIIYAFSANQSGYLISNFTLVAGMAFFTLHFLMTPHFFNPTTP